jgi:hypothetical protein
MFKLTRQEQLIVAFLVGAIVLGTAVKEWRARAREARPAATVQKGDR